MTNPVVEEIKSRISIVDFIGQYLRLAKAGANWKALCPFHHEKTPSFMVNEEKQIFHCFGCGKSGDIFSFLMEMEALDFKEALKILADKAGVQLTQYKPEITDSKNKVLEILELSTKFYETQLWKGAGKEKILGYLRERGIKDNAIKEFRLGYAPPGWRNLLKFLVDQGYKIEDIAKTGLLVEKEAGSLAEKYYDRFRDRIIFPISDIIGKIIGFSARVAPGGDESQAKYVNTPETIVYHKSRVLYGIDKAKKEIKDKDQVVLVEGNMDVIASSQAGIKNVVAISGTALTPEQLEILKRYTQNLKIFFDMDAAGEAAIRRSAEIAFPKSLNVCIISPEEGKDAAEIVQKDPKILLDAVEKAIPAMEYFLAKIFSRYDKERVADKKKIAADALDLIKSIGNEIERSHWTKKLANELGVEDKILADALRKIQLENKVTGTKRSPEEPEIISEERAGVIRKKIIGLMLAYPNVWKEVLNNYGEKSFLLEDNLFQILFGNGPEADFEIGKLLVIIKDEPLKELFRELAFKNKYQFDEKTGVEEFDPDKARELAGHYIYELKKEIKKKKMEDILKDIKKAEAGGDRKELQFLMEEFNKLSKKFK